MNEHPKCIICGSFLDELWDGPTCGGKEIEPRLTPEEVTEQQLAREEATFLNDMSHDT